MRKKIYALLMCVCLGIGGLPLKATASESETEMSMDMDKPDSPDSEIGRTEKEEIVFTAEASQEMNRNGGLTTLYYPASESDHSESDISGGTIADVIKQRAVEALENEKDTFDVSDLGIVRGSSEFDTLIDALYDVISLDYRYFYVSSFSYSYRMSDNLIAGIRFNYAAEYVNLDNSLNREKVLAKRTELENAVNEALDCTAPEMTAVEKVLAVHDYIVSVCDYDYENYLKGSIPESSFRIEGVLTKGAAVCQGYAETFCTLMRKLGIDSYLVSSDAMNHAWNLVSIDGAWYHVDCTWDDPVWSDGYTSIFDGRGNNDYADEGYVGHTYFLKSDEEFQNLDHNGWSAAVPAAEKSGAYENYCFFNVNQKMNYYNSDWFYLKTYNSNQIMKAKINEKATEAVELGGSAYYMHGLNDTFYYAAVNEIYAYNPATGVEKLFYNAAEEYPGYQINEFAVKHQQLIAVLYNGATSDYKRIAITPENVRVTGVSLNKTELMFTEAGAAEQLAAVITPENASDKEATWSSSDLSVASVSETGLVTAAANGTCTITVTTKDGNKTASCHVTVAIPDNPDPDNPDPDNPDPDNPDPDNPDPDNPDPDNPDPDNPDPDNPDPDNPDPDNPDPDNPDQDDQKPLPPSGRIAGTSRYSTALECAERMRSASLHTTEDGKFTAAVIACAENFPDALAGSTLAASVHAPILLVGKNAFGTNETLAYINQNVKKDGTLYLLGGTSAIPESVADALAAYGFQAENIRTLAGSSRYETNLKIVDELNVSKGTDIVIVSGKTYADSLSVSGIAGAEGMPIFLAAGALSEEAVDRIREIAPEHIYMIGGTAAVSEDVRAQAESLCANGPANVIRIAGTSRYATSLAVAEYFGMEKASAAVFAYGGDFPDGLTGGAFAAGLNAPVILVSDSNYQEQEAFLRSSGIENIYIMGGTSVISDETMKHLMK